MKEGPKKLPKKELNVFVMQKENGFWEKMFWDCKQSKLLFS